MGGIIKGVGRTVRSVVRHPLRALPAAAGFATGNPWIAAASGAVIGAHEGGTKGAIAGAIGAGLGASLGGSLGMSSAQSLPALMIGKTNYLSGMTALGAALGARSGMNSTKPPSLSSESALNSSAVPSAPLAVPTFNEMRQDATINARKVFEREGIYDILNQAGRNKRSDQEDTYRVLNPFRRFKTEIAPHERGKFPSLKKATKEQAKKRARELAFKRAQKQLEKEEKNG